MDKDYKPSYSRVELPGNREQRLETIRKCDGGDVLVRVKNKGDGLWMGNMEIEKGLCYLTGEKGMSLVFWPDNIESLFVKAE
jgi:hypothetical protein